jgi:high potential iron-sulfur protein
MQLSFLSIAPAKLLMEHHSGIQAKRVMIMHRNMTRRALVKGGLVAGALVPIAGLFINTVAHADASALDPSEQTAKALNYVTKSTKSDASCANCSQYQGKAGDAMGPCGIFPGKSVAAAGWCSGWAKKVAS